jgi:hypothetical protein
MGEKMKTYYFYPTRKQIVVVWADGAERSSRAYSRNERGARAANAKMARLLADGYTQQDAPKDWFSAILDKVREAR